MLRLLYFSSGQDIFFLLDKILSSGQDISFLLGKIFLDTVVFRSEELSSF